MLYGEDGLSIEIKSDGTISSLRLSGTEFSGVARRIVYEHTACDVPRLTLELYPESVHIESKVEAIEVIQDSPLEK